MYGTNVNSAESLAGRFCSTVPTPITGNWQFCFQWAWLVLVVAQMLVCNLTAAELSLPTRVAHGENVVNANIDYSPQGANAADLEFDLEYDPNALSITAEPGSATLSAGKFLAMSTLSPGHIRFLIFGFNLEIVGDGSVVVLTIQVTSNSALGPHRLDIVNAQGADPTGQAVPVEARSGLLVRAGPP